MHMTRKFLMITFTLMLGLLASVAKADNVDSVTMLFQSGATFTGTVTFASDNSSVTGANGTLTDYQAGVGFQLGATDSIVDVYSSVNFASDPGNWSNFLLDVPSGSFAGLPNWIVFTYNYSGGFPVFTDDSGVTPFSNAVNGPVDGSDPLVSGSIVATPEPSSLFLLGVGLAGLLAKAKAKKQFGLAEN